MYADPKELKRLRRRVERRVRGKVLYMLHLGIAALCTVVAMMAAVVNLLNGYVGLYGWRAFFAPFQVVMLFIFTLGVHTLLRWLNRMAQRTREMEMERELRQAGYYGEIEKRKHEAAYYARLSDDGELSYVEDVDGNYDHAVSGNH